MDINCDLGEGLANDVQIMPYISSCNIACGGHVGSLETMKETVLLAKKYHVKIGAHPSFIDRDNFGRKELFIPKDVLRNQIISQVKTLKEVSDKEGIRLHHVKPHGALYNMASKFNDVAEAVIEAVQFFEVPLILYVPYGSVISEKLKENKLPFYYESFADRMYQDDLSLVSRKVQDSLIENTKIIIKRVNQLTNANTITTRSGKNVSIKTDTICVHGDNPNAVEIVKKLSQFI